MFKKKVKADLGKFVQAKTRNGEIKGVLVPFRGKQMVENRSGIYDIREVTDVTPTQTLGKDTRNFLQAVRRRHELS